MSVTQDQVIGELQRANAVLRDKLDVALARHGSESCEWVAHQAATVDVLKAMSASPGDPKQVFDLIVRRAHELCDSPNVALTEYDGELVHLRSVVTMQGDPAAMARWTQGFPRAPSPGPSGDVYRNGQAVHIRDNRAEPGVDETTSAAAMGSTAGLPVLHLGKVVGAIFLAKVERGGYSDIQIELLKTFAEQAAIAIGNAGTYRALQARTADLQESLEQQTATAAVLEVINASPGNLAPVFDALLEKAMRLCGAAFGTLLRHENNVWHLVATRGLPAAVVRAIADSLIPRFGSVWQCVETKRPVHVLDALDDEAYLRGNLAGRRFVELGGVRTVIRVPLVKDGVMHGVIAIYRQEVRAFSAKETAVLENFAAQAVIAMENARLIDEIRAARDTAEATLSELKTAQANLIQAEKMASLGQLTAGIAHEIKNPLNFVNNFSAVSTELIDELQDVLAHEPLGDTARAEVDDLTAMLKGNLEKVVHHGKRADGIVKSMLEHSRGASAERRTVNLNALVDEALNLAYHGARAQDPSFNITLEREFGNGIAPIELNPQDMTRVFLNLFSNGFYAANQRAQSGTDADFDPTLKVATRDVGGTVEIHVRDNGAGIPPDIRDKLFQPFFTTKPTGEGTGLGLSITYDIVTQAHGGRIAVDSEIGQFTEFVVGLPRKMFTLDDGLV